MPRFYKTAEIANPGQLTLPGRYYTSDEVYLLEQERVFRRRWICAGREERIGSPGDYFVRNLGTESIIFVRGKDGAIRAFHNVCRHRGTRICEAENGTFTNAIRCPYHSWAYGFDGALIAAPFMEGVQDFDPAQYPLHPVSVALWEGFIFFSL